MADQNARFEYEDLIPSEEQFAAQIASAGESPTVSRLWEEVAKARERPIVVSFMGTASSGKTSCIKAVYGVDLGSISPVPGSTKDVKVLEVLSGPPKVYVADCPGFGDIDRTVEGKAREMIRNSAGFIYLVNPTGIQQQEEKDLAAIRALNRPVLVVLNKMDTVHARTPAERARRSELSESVRQKASGCDFAFAAVDPLGDALPLGVDSIRLWIADKLGPMALNLAKDERDALAEKWILGAAGVAFGIGAIPIPGSDIIPITAEQVALIVKVASIYGHRADKKDAMALMTQIFAGQVGRQVFRWVITGLKAAGWIPGPGWALELVVAGVAGSVAASITFGLGKAAQAYYRSDMRLPLAEAQEVYKEMFKQYRQKPTASTSPGLAAGGGA